MPMNIRSVDEDKIVVDKIADLNPQLVTVAAD
jgi:hypothetical protein